MEKFRNLLRSKAFWTLVAGIVAALTAFFTASCTGYTRTVRKGLHCDTVYYDQYFKSKSYIP